MELKRKLTILADAAKHDASCASGGSKRSPTGPKGIGSSEGMGICHSYTPDGRCVSLLKILLTNYCVFDCSYCESRISSSVERARFTPEEVVKLTLDFYRRNYIEGLFLSSGILKDADTTMEEILRVAKLLREEHGFGGYIHLKTPPGVSDLLLREAGTYADRLSVNTELPTDTDLSVLAPEKSLASIEQVMTDVKSSIDESKESKTRFTPAGQTTQMIVGATATDDLTILTTSDRLYRTHSLRRVYYAAFSPIVHARPGLATEAPPLVREHRLYEADWLVRQYGFTVEELFDRDASAFLSAHIDPKLAWALRHREQFPVDVNTAPREMLLRVPGLGVKNVDRILRARKHRRLRHDDLARMRVVLGRAAAFLLTADPISPDVRRLDELALEKRLQPASQQLGLFDAKINSRTGQL